MIKRKEIIHTVKRKNEIINDILNAFEPIPAFNRNYLSNFNKYINSSKKFTGNIRQDQINLSSKSLLYWPTSTIEIDTAEAQTVIKIRYRKFWLYACFYLLMLIFYIINVLIYVIDKSYSKNVDGAEAIFVLLAFFILLPVFGRWLQRNTVKFLIS